MVQPEMAFMGPSGILLADEENDPSPGFIKNGSIDVSTSDFVASHGSSDAKLKIQGLCFDLLKKSAVFVPSSTFIQPKSALKIFKKWSEDMIHGKKISTLIKLG